MTEKNWLTYAITVPEESALGTLEAHTVTLATPMTFEHPRPTVRRD